MTIFNETASQTSPAPDAPSTAGRRGRTRVLMVGPHMNLPGGMSTVARVLANTVNRTDDAYSVDLVDSGGGRGAVGYAHFLPAALRTAVESYSLLHLHVAEKGSTIRKGVLARIARARRIPYVLHLHAAEYGPFLEGASPRMTAWVRDLHQHAAHNIVLGDDSFELLTGRLGVSASRVTIVRNGVEEVGKAPDRDKEADRYLVFLGEVSERKGADVLLTALEQLRDRDLLGGFRTVFLGPLVDPAIEERSSRLGDVVELVGSVSGDDLDDRLRRASIFVLPSRAEALPMAILEALSASLPVVVTDVGSIAQVIHDGDNGIVLQPDDADGLTAALARLISDPSLRERLGERGHAAWAADFSAEAMAAGIEGVWDTCFPTHR